MVDEGQSPAPYIPDDLLVEIFSRLPAKSLCRFKCVSRSWRALITDPAHRRRFAQTLSGIFSRHHDGIPTTWGWGFTAFSTPPPLSWPWGNNGDSTSSLPSLPAGIIKLLDCCNGLLLLRCSSRASGAAAQSSSPPPSPDFYVVCNPATGEWVTIPQPSLEPGYDGLSEDSVMIRTCSAALSFDPSISSHFHVFQLLEEVYYRAVGRVKSVEIYSSETGEWVLRESGWQWGTAVGDHHMYFNGFQHFTSFYGDSVAMVDVKGQAWREIKFPISSGDGFVGHSRGRLLYVERGDALAVYALDDHGGDEWTFKHRITKLVRNVWAIRVVA